MNLGAYCARTETDGADGDDESYQGRFEYGADRYGAQLEYLKVGDNFNPEVGFLRRDNFAPLLRLGCASARGPKGSQARPEVHWRGDVEYFVNGAGAARNARAQTARFNTEFENSDLFTVDVTDDYELLVAAVPVSPASMHPARRLRVQRRRPSRTRSARSAACPGTCRCRPASTTTARSPRLTLQPRPRVAVLKQLSLEPSSRSTASSCRPATFTTKSLRARTDYGFSPLMFASGLLQYSSADHAFSSNLRFRWEYVPGSELFVVYTDERDTLQPGYPDLKNRAFVVKINRLFRF